MKAVLLVFGLLLLGQSPAWARDDTACPPGSYLKRVGAVGTAATESITTSAVTIYASRVACTTTACKATLYDGDWRATSLTDGIILDEPGTIASASAWTIYDPPLRAFEGVVSHDDANVVAIMLYTCVGSP